MQSGNCLVTTTEANIYSFLYFHFRGYNQSAPRKMIGASGLADFKTPASNVC